MSAANTGNRTVHRKRPAREVLRNRAVDMAIGGATYAAIAKALGISKTHAFELVDEELTARAGERKGKSEELRQQQVERLREIHKALWRYRNRPENARALVRVQERLAKLLGLDAPEKRELSGPDGGPIQIEHVSAALVAKLMGDEE